MMGPINGRPTLMLVDDEPEILVALQDLFGDQYEVIAYTSAADALAALDDRGDVAVIISDQRMPGMTGDVFLAAARERSDASAILLTGYADLGAVTAAVNAGGIVGYAPKPWDPPALRAMVSSACEQHQLRRSLRQEQALLRGLMEHVPFAVAFKDLDGRFLHLNGQKAAAFGRPAEECVGRSEEELGGKSSAAEQDAVAQASPRRELLELPGPGGSTWTQVDHVPLKGAAGDVEALVVLARDVTAERLAEQELRQTEKLRALGTLAGGVAHDFNNLLTAIVGSLELATKKMQPDDRVRKYLDNAALAAQRGAALTRRLLGFSRRTESAPVVTDIGAALQGMRELLASTIGATVQVDWRIAEDLWPSCIEPDQLEVAVLNLAINARDAMPKGGAISITAENACVAPDAATTELSAGEYVLLSVGDTGEGIPPEVLERILEPFFTTKPVGKGTGLGLPMVYGFAQRSGGGLIVDSRVGEGTRVSLYLPRAGHCAEADSVPTVPTSPVPRACILVVDDEPGVRSITAASLREMGHQVLEADGAAQAIEVLHAQSVDLALVDFAMPDVNGIDLIGRMRRDGFNVPAILLTGYFDVDAVPSDLPVLHKPFTQAALAEAISRAVTSS